MNVSEARRRAMQEIKKRRSEAIQLAECNKHKMLSIPEYLNVANRLGELTILIAKARINNNEQLLKEVKEKHQKAKIEEVKILKQYNLTIEDLEPNYICKICEDKGVINGKFCKCYNDILNRYIGSNEQKQIMLKDCKLIDNKYVELMQKVVDSYIENKSILNLYITGSVGVGKSYLTQALLNEFNTRQLSTLFATAPQLNASFLDYHKCFDDEEKNNIINCFIDSNVLVIDDLGTEPMLNNVTKEYLLMLISERINRQNLTIISSNLSADEVITRYGERLFSRLFNERNSIAINIQGKDLRLKEI